MFKYYRHPTSKSSTYKIKTPQPDKTSGSPDFTTLPQEVHKGHEVHQARSQDQHA